MAEWRGVVGWGDLYRVSDQGEVWSARSGRMLRQRSGGHRYGYLTVELHRGGRRRVLKVHRVVANAFLGSLPPSLQTRHLNGTSTDNRVTNLEYGTGSQNVRESVVFGTHMNARKTHCPARHEYTPENTEWIGKTKNIRRCIECMRDRNRAWRWSKKVAA